MARRRSATALDASPVFRRVEWGNMHLPATRVPRARRRMSLAFGAVARYTAFGM